MPESAGDSRSQTISTVIGSLRDLTDDEMKTLARKPEELELFLREKLQEYIRRHSLRPAKRRHSSEL
jgi:hypothetical protein